MPKNTVPDNRLTPWYGWRPDMPDNRDLVRRVPEKFTLPASVDLRPKCPPVYNQLELGSCTANAIAGALEFDQRKQGLAEFVPSRLFICYCERVIEGTIGTDAGAEIRDGIKAVASLGAPDERLWPYDIKKFAKKPPTPVYGSAKGHLALKYARVQRTALAMKHCLAAGYPFTLGFSVYSGFESEEVAKTGVMNMPGPGEQLLGGHAVLVVGYTQDRLIVRNSWDVDWGQAGYFTMPMEYALNPNLADDFWQIQTVE